MAAREARWRAVARFAANVLREGRDRFGPEPTPLCADGLDLADRNAARRSWLTSFPAARWSPLNIRCWDQPDPEAPSIIKARG